MNRNKKNVGKITKGRMVRSHRAVMNLLSVLKNSVKKEIRMKYANKELDIYGSDDAIYEIIDEITSNVGANLFEVALMEVEKIKKEKQNKK